MKRYECRKCGVVTTGKQHLCQSEAIPDERSCGVDKDKVKDMCEPMQQKATHRCGFCGRPSNEPELLCNPEMTGAAG